MRNMLEEGLEAIQTMNYSARIVWRVQELLNRAIFYDEDPRINLINLPLGEAIKTHPDIVGCADIVVDNCGAHYYPQIEFPFSKPCLADKIKVHGIRNQLIKAEGLLVIG
jgi:hypothetical protein